MILRLDDTTLAIGVSIGDALNDALVTAALDIDLPGPLADVADWVLPDDSGRGGWFERAADGR